MTLPGERAAWLRLLLTPGLGRESARRLLAAFGSPQAVFEGDPTQWRDLVGARAAALAQVPDDWASQVDLTESWLAEDATRDLVPLGDPRYPPLLLQQADPPLLLFVHGRSALLQADAVAVVGSRHPSPQGRDNARAFAARLGAEGLCIVSGLASGIDGSAHEGALTAVGGTVAVVGTGLDRVYPTAHRGLARRIAAEGLLVSEYPLGTPPLPTHFPQRNRIIAGLSLGTLVVEAAPQSGSLITARLAADMGREVFAIPGSIHLPQSRGCHALIRQGAKLVETADDVLEELRRTPSLLPPDPVAPQAGRSPDDELLEALGQDPATLDTLAARTGLPLPTLSARLLELELAGRVARLPGGWFQRRATA